VPPNQLFAGPEATPLESHTTAAAAAAMAAAAPTSGAVDAAKVVPDSHWTPVWKAAWNGMARTDPKAMWLLVTSKVTDREDITNTYTHTHAHTCVCAIE
jgi:hypothetical protein